MQLVFATGNASKFQTAQKVLEAAGIMLKQADLDIPEIQSEDGEAIARDKAAKAFAHLGRPVVVSDDTWEIPGLRGFPGPYMKFINHWFTTADFLRLTASLTDRRVFLVNHLVYTDGRHAHAFTNRRTGTLLTAARGDGGPPSHQLIAMVGDNGLSQAEAFAQGADHLNPERTQTWQQLAAYLSDHSQ